MKQYKVYVTKLGTKQNTAKLYIKGTEWNLNIGSL